MVTTRNSLSDKILYARIQWTTQYSDKGGAMYRQLAMCLTVATLTTAASSEVRGQAERTASNTIFLELGGNALIYSLNYERVLPSDMAVRVGFGHVSVSATSGLSSASVTSTSIPITASYLGIGGSTKLELGGGVLFQRFSGSTSTGFGNDIEAGVFVPLATFITGLRVAPPGGGFNFKLAFTPIWHPDVGFFPWGSLGFGVGF